MKVKLMKPIKGGHGGCLHCGYQYEILPMEAVIAVGFGGAEVTKNGKTIYYEQMVEHDKRRKLWTVKRAEQEARKDPDNDWRIHLFAPLSERHYQRQGKTNGFFIKRAWVLHETYNNTKNNFLGGDMKNKGGSVFPILDTTQANDINSLACIEGGMDLRDYFAGQALVGIMLTAALNPDSFVEAKKQIEKEEGKRCELSELVAMNAYVIADFMLSEREKEQ